MTNCPICHVKNHDDARFCAECGQRLGAQGQAPPVAPAQTAQPQPQPPTSDVRAAQAPRLHSPLLSSGSMESIRPDNAANAAEVNRLHQLSSRGKDDPAVNHPESPYKNPFDPRNSLAQQSSPSPGGGPGPSSGTGTNQPSDAPRHKLRSPLLSGEEFDDEDQDQQYNDASGPSSQNLGSGLRSPLLGGGGSGSYRGQERRSAQPESDLGNQERRHHLRSPLLHNAEPYYYDEPAADLEDATSEDDPNVLRSPLLAAKRPMIDRPSVNSPSASNTQMPTRPAQAPEALQFGANKPAPSSAHNSLRSIDASAPQNNAPQAPNTAAPAAPAAPPASPIPPASPAAQSAPVNATAAPMPSASAGPHPYGNSQAPQTVPAAFQNLQSGQIPPSAAAELRMQTAPPTATTGNINPEAAAAAPFRPPASTTPPIVQEPQRRPSSHLLAGAYDDTDEQHYGGPALDRLPAPASSSAPAMLPKLIGGIAVLLLMGKLYVIATFLQTQWRDSLFLVVDQIIGMALIICLIVLAFSQKNR